MNNWIFFEADNHLVHWTLDDRIKKELIAEAGENYVICDRQMNVIDKKGDAPFIRHLGKGFFMVSIQGFYNGHTEIGSRLVDTNTDKAYDLFDDIEIIKDDKSIIVFDENGKFLIDSIE